MLSPKAISFAGCGALNFYQVGVAQALQTTVIQDDSLLLGASAGGGLAFLLAAGYAPQDIVRRMLTLTANAVGPSRWLGPAGVQAIGAAFGEEFVESDAHLKVSGRIALSITRLRPLGNIRATHFTSRDDLTAALRATCFIPSRSRPWLLFRGSRCIDGGATDNEPIIDEHTLRVSPLWTSVRAHIKPSPRRVGLNEAIRLPTETRAWKLFDLGFADGHATLAALRGSATAARKGQGLWKHAPAWTSQEV